MDRVKNGFKACKYFSNTKDTFCLAVTVSHALRHV